MFSFLHISKQGCRNDIKKTTSIMQASDDQCIVPPLLDVSSDSVHCNALTQSSTVSYAFSCHTTDTCWEEQDIESALALPPPHSKCHYHSWVHVFFLIKFHHLSTYSVCCCSCSTSERIIAKGSSPEILLCTEKETEDYQHTM